MPRPAPAGFALLVSSARGFHNAPLALGALTQHELGSLGDVAIAEAQRARRLAGKDVSVSKHPHEQGDSIANRSVRSRKHSRPSISNQGTYDLSRAAQALPAVADSAPSHCLARCDRADIG